MTVRITQELVEVTLENLRGEKPRDFALARRIYYGLVRVYRRRQTQGTIRLFLTLVVMYRDNLRGDQC